MIIGYGLTLTFAIALLFLYFVAVKKREFWLGLLFVCVAVVNLGYLLLSVSKTVGFAIFANDLAYLGSVYLSMCMLFTIMKLCGFKVTIKHVITCVSLGAVMFLIVATVGFLPIYYKSVAIEKINGATKLIKEYGVLHNAYLVYLAGYFIAMIVTIVCSVVKNKIASQKFAGIIASIVLINLFIWFIEKFGEWNFEFLSVSYIFSEIMFVLLFWTMQDYVLKNEVANYTYSQQIDELGVAITTMPMEIKLNKILQFAKEPLAIREREILELILKNKKRKDIATELLISENTVKTHTRVLYSKLGVSSRNELFNLALKD